MLHVDDLLIRSGTGIPWPLNDVSSVIEFSSNQGLGGTWDIQFQSVNTCRQLSFIEIPIKPTYDYCMLHLTGSIDSLGLDVGNQLNNNEGYLYGFAFGEEREDQLPVGVKGPLITTKHDAWAAGCMSIIAQTVSGTPPFFGYAGPSLNTATTQSRLTPQGFLVNRGATGLFNMVADDKFSVLMSVGRMRMGKLCISGLQKLYVRFACTNPTLLTYNPQNDYLNVTMRLTAHFFEEGSREYD